MSKLNDQVHGFAVGAGAASISVAAVTLLKFGAGADAVLSLTGAFLGAVITVGGAAILAERASKAELSAELSILINEYEPLEQLCRTYLGIERQGDIDREERPEVLSNILGRIWECKTITAEALETSKHLTFRHRTRLREVLTAASSFWDRVQESGFEPVLDPKVSKVTFISWEVMHIQRAIEAALDQFGNRNERAANPSSAVLPLS